MSENQYGPGNETPRPNTEPEPVQPAQSQEPQPYVEPTPSTVEPSTAATADVPRAEEPAPAEPMATPTAEQPAPTPEQQAWGPVTTPLPVPAPSSYGHPTLQPPTAGAPSPWAPTGAYQPGSPAWHAGPGVPPPGSTYPPYTTYPPAGPRKPTPAWRKWAVGGVAALVLAGAAGGIGGLVGYNLNSNASSPFQSSVSANGNAPVVDRSSLATIAAKLQPTVVSIQTGNAEGSGVIISSDGYIVTNNHVVAAGNGQTVQVTFNSGRKVSATVVGTDPKTDLAVVKADASGLTTATWGDSNNVNVGDTVLAIGSPLGLQGSVTAGIVSALHRTIQVSDQQDNPLQSPGGSTTIGDAIQTDAPINPGNSGGALVATNGQVIGINSAIATGSSGSNGNIGVGFAISSNRAKAVAEQLIKGEKVSHPYLGISVGDAQAGGAQVQQVVAGSPAAKAGIQQGDVVTKVNGTPIANSEALIGAVQSSTVGSTMTLSISRNGAEQTVTVTVGEAP